MSQNDGTFGEEKLYKLLICGSRFWTDRDKIVNFLQGFPWRNTVVIHGANGRRTDDGRVFMGADLLAAEAAAARGMTVRSFPADWDMYGKSAGPLRNEQMLSEGRPTLVVAFHNNLSQSKGTAHMLRIAREAGIPTRTIA